MSQPLEDSQLKCPFLLRTDQRPLYAQASEVLRALVRRGGYAPGDRLPSEIQLSHQLGISRPTLREALRLLEEESVIVRRHGVGTFVGTLQPVIDSGLEVLESIDRIAERQGLETSMAEPVIEEHLATDREAERLALTPGTPVTAVIRVTMAAGQRVANLVDVVPQEFLQRTHLQFDFHGSVLDHFLAVGRPLLSHSWTELSTETANAELARALHVARGDALLRLEAQLYAQDGRVVDYSISHFVPGYFKFHVIRRIG